MKIRYENGRYLVESSYGERFIPKDAGCRWNPEEKIWWTDKAAVAVKMRKYFDKSAEEAYAISERQIEASKKTDSDAVIPAPDGLAYLPFQKAGIAYALEREATLIADEMGLGKTIQALGVINADETIKRVLVICPASLRLNWKREAEKWLIRKMMIQIVEGRSATTLAGDIVIMNYDIVSAHRLAIDMQEWDLLISDEAHYLKNAKALRTQAIIGKKANKRKPEEKEIPAIKAQRRLLLTGTPIVNRPVELWTLISYLAPLTFVNFFGYAKRYCGAERTRFGWDFGNATNLDELQDTLRASCMVRRLKKDVLTELPPKRRQIIELPTNGASGCIEDEKKISIQLEGRLNDLQAKLEIATLCDGDTTEIMQNIRDAQTMAFTEMARARHETAMAKLPYCLEHILEAVESSGQVVVFAHHKDVIAGIVKGLTKEQITCVTLTGDDAMSDRQNSVDLFQSGKAQVFIGSISAAGVGITLTNSAHVIFCELPWTPSELSQAEDRCHRIGQKESVLIQHIVLEDSIDQRMAQALVEKQQIIDEALDILVRKQLSECPVLPTMEKRKTEKKEKFDRIAAIITDEQIAKALECMRQIAGMDEDFARSKNNIGFSKVDCCIGHELAEKSALSKKQGALAAVLANKYRRQIELGILENLFILNDDKMCKTK